MLPLTMNNHTDHNPVKQKAKKVVDHATNYEETLCAWNYLYAKQNMFSMAIKVSQPASRKIL